MSKKVVGAHTHNPRVFLDNARDFHGEEHNPTYARTWVVKEKKGLIEWIRKAIMYIKASRG